MDIQSAALIELFVLYPLSILGWVTPVKPDGIAHGGIPKAIYDGQAPGLECLVDPWTELQLNSWIMAVDDRVDLYCNGNLVPGAGKTVKPGEETLRQRLYLPHGNLTHGVNRLHYVVTRVGGNSEPSRDLLVLYHLRPADTQDLVIPPDVLKDGVSAARAAQGVEFGFTYANRRNYDRIEFLLGDTQVRFDVPDGTAPITHKLFTDTFQKAGDNPSAVAEFYVVDQLGNRVKSPEKRLDIHLDRLDLPAPTVKGQTGTNFSPTQPEVRVLVPQGSLLPTDKLSVFWRGAAGTPLAGSYTSPQRLVSAGLEIAVPRSVLAYNLGKQATVIYDVERNGKTTTSLPLPLNILPLPASALITPKIVEADANNFLDVMALGSKNATIHALLHTLIEAGQPCWLSLEGKKANGTAHNLALWNGLPEQVNDTWISQGFWPVALVSSYLTQLGHGTTLTIKFKVSLDKSNNPATATVFPDRPYNIKAVALEVPTLVNVLNANNVEVQEGTSTTSDVLKLKGKASNSQNVEIFDGSGPSAVSKGIATAHMTTGIWERTITVPVGIRRLYAKSLYHPSSVYSNVRNLTVVAVIVPTLVNVLDANNVEVQEGTRTTSITLKLKGEASNGQQVEIFDGSGSSAVSKGMATANKTTGIWELTITVLAGIRRLYAKSLYHPSPVYSNVRNLTVVATKPSITVITDSIGQVAHNGTTYDTKVTVTVTADPNQSIQLYDGAKTIGAPIPLDSKGNGTTTLSALEQKVFSLTARAVYGNQLESSVRIFTRKAHLAVTLTSVKHSRGELGEGASTASVSVTLEGRVTPLYSVQIYHNNSAKNIVQSNASGFWTTPLPIGAGLNTVYAKAVATGLNSNSRSFTRVVPITSENFDQYSTRHVSPGLNIPLNSMTIYYLGGTGFIGIAPLADLFTGPYPQIPGRSYGQTLEMHWKGLGTSQHMRIRFNWGYSSVSFFVRFAQTPNLWIRFLDINNNIIHQYTLPLNFDAQLVSYSHPSIDIWGVEVQTSQMDLISIDYFQMAYR
ncbi:hypothetical protein [Pseudomonas sp. fls2-241-R2A-110]|uniref:hypothetical protein n=1 Tax=Pseudomonas sp. fls2-241-R2A-110 TaxID=3040311 RepID=UPI002557A1C1|nr:hypothetical protein [Pseudomonas sp. fls2-241-R2A-110]